jgi:hypothetical protein
MMTPSDEMCVLRSLPETFTKDQVFSMIAALQADMAKESPPRSWQDRVKRYSVSHGTLLVAYPMLYRSVCRGSYRPSVVDALIDARDAMASGVSKKDALETVIRRAVDEVSQLREQSK